MAGGDVIGGLRISTRMDADDGRRFAANERKSTPILHCFIPTHYHSSQPAFSGLMRATSFLMA